MSKNGEFIIGSKEKLLNEIIPDQESVGEENTGTHEESLTEDFLLSEETETEDFLYVNGKRIPTAGGLQKNKKRKKPKEKNTVVPPKIDPREKVYPEAYIKEIIDAITDSVDKTDSISSNQLRKAIKINDPYLNNLLLNIPGETVVYLDTERTRSKTMHEIRAEPELLDVAESVVPEKETIQTTEIVNRTQTIPLQEDKEASTQSTENTAIQRPDNFMKDLTEEEAYRILNTSHRNLENSDAIFPGIDSNTNKTQTKDVPQENSPAQPTMQKTKETGNLEGLLSIAQTKDDLIAIVSKSNDLRDGLWGTQQTYSRDDLVALIEATWNGEVGIDHLPRTAGFREAVDRVRENERNSNLKIAKRKTAEELTPAIEATIEMENMLGVPEDEQIYGYNKKDRSFIYNYPKTPETKEIASKNKGIFRKLWSIIKRLR